MTLADLSLMWITTRAAGIVALVASTGSIVLGLALAGRVGSERRRGVLGDVRVLHQTLGIATVVALLVHVVTLMLDPWLSPTIGEVAIPFTIGYRPLWTGLGIIAGYGILVLGMSGFLRARLGKRWNVIHRFTAVAWVMSVIHTIGAGTDGTTPWMLVLVTLCVAPVVVLAALRIRKGLANRTDRSTGGGHPGGGSGGGRRAPVVPRPSAEARAAAQAAAIR